MAFWEFLLQREGDRSWLPVEATKVEILEGCYRIVAHSDQLQVPVEIRVTHHATAEVPLIRRTQKRHSKTNQNGLVVVMPFTRLLPGVWDFQCASDVMADMLGEGWSYAVQLQVLSELEVDEDWDPEWSGGTEAADVLEVLPLQDAQAGAMDLLPLASPVEASPIASMPASDDAPGSALEAQAEKQMRSVQPAADLEDLPTEAMPLGHRKDEISGEDYRSDLQTSNILPLNSEVRLHLAQETYVIQRNRPLTLMGQVELVDTQGSSPVLPVGALTVRLYDPQTSRVLVDEQQPLTAQRAPFPFTCQVTLPKHYQTYLLLGEMILYGAALNATETSPVVLAKQSFTVTTDLHELLESIANDYTESDIPPPKGSSAPEEQDAQAITFLNAPPTDIHFRPSQPQPLPPQLHPVDLNKPQKSPELPAFAHDEELEAESPILDAPAVDTPVVDTPVVDTPVTDTPVTDTDAVDIPAVKESSENIDAILNADPERSITVDQYSMTETETADRDYAERTETRQNNIAETSIAEGLEAPTTLQSGDLPPSRNEQDDHLTLLQTTPAVEKPETPEDIAFRSLNLQERFWSRLQALMSDQELVTCLSDLAVDSANTEGEAVGDRGSQFGGQRSRDSVKGLDAELTAQEVVAEDELDAVPEQHAEAALMQDGEPPVLILPDEEPIPVPQLDVRSDAAIAGENLDIVVRLPDLPTRLFVKVWVRDRQSRSVLDGPQWLMGFLPDGFGRLTARTALPVPHGCLEVQIEAITVEIASQRESDKATVIRQVSLPNTSFSFDELDV